MSRKVFCLWTLCMLCCANEIQDEGLILNQDDVLADPVQCPECDERRCVADLECRDGEVLREKQTVCGCCPGCVILLKLGEPCNPGNFGPRCEEGLVCDPTLLECILKSDAKCMSYQNLDILWKPKCESDGTYAALQCKGQKLTGRCFCYSPDGKKLFGAEWWSEAENMTCACSRLRWQLENAALEKDRRTDVTLHCNQLGNFEELQCDNGLCWCADEKTGDPITTVLPENLMTVLPCYNASVIGSQYLRQCESKAIAAARIGIEMTQHGMQFRKSIKDKCDADGSYGHFQVNDKNRVECTWKDGSWLPTYADQVVNLQSINCNCARDERYYAEAGKEFHKYCNGNGNYMKGQFDTSGKWYCVDQDGFAITEPIVLNPGENIESEVCVDLPDIP